MAATIPIGTVNRRLSSQVLNELKEQLLDGEMPVRLLICRGSDGRAELPAGKSWTEVLAIKLEDNDIVFVDPARQTHRLPFNADHFQTAVQ